MVCEVGRSSRALGELGNNVDIMMKKLDSFLNAYFRVCSPSYGNLAENLAVSSKTSNGSLICPPLKTQIPLFEHKLLYSQQIHKYLFGSIYTLFSWFLTSSRFLTSSKPLTIYSKVIHCISNLLVK